MNTSTSMAPVWSAFQQAIFDDIANGEGHTVVEALAGTGKTTTIVAGLEFVPSHCSAVVMAFNNKIASELADRCPQHIPVMTTHSYGFRALKRVYKKVNLVEKGAVSRLRNILTARLGDSFSVREKRMNLQSLVSKAKAQLAETAEQIDSLIDAFSIDCGETPAERADFIKDAIWALEECAKDPHNIDFDDMVWLPVKLDIKVPTFDRVFIDETQDLNAAQLELALRACARDGGRITAIGDANQAIYGFRGADERAIPRIIERLNAKVLPLSITYRCGKNIVKIANEIVPSFQAGPDNADGVVTSCTAKHVLAEAKPGDFVLSRSNAPLLGLCLQFIKQGTRANVLGRDVGGSLATLVKKAKTNDIVEFTDYIERWHARESARLEKKKASTQAVDDKRACIEVLSEGAADVNAILGNIERLFADGDDKSRIVLSTTHKAKGLERDRVFVLRDTYLRDRKDKSGRWTEPSQEEKNLYYVAVTRAKQVLFLASGKIGE